MDKRRAPQKLRPHFQARMLFVVLSSIAFSLFAIQIASSPAQSNESDQNAITPAASVSTSGWPDATNTGVPPGVTLVPSGDLVITKTGAVVSGLDIQGAVDINASNVTLMNSRVRAARFSVVQIKPGMTGVVIQDCEIDGIGTGNEGSNGIFGSGTFLRNNIFHVENGIALNGSATIQDNYIHDLLASGSPHYDGIQIDGGISNVMIRHNTVINSYNQTSAIMIDNYFGPISNISVDNNLLVGGGYTVYSSAQFNGGPVTGVSFTNNRLGKGRWGYRAFTKNNPVWRGNVYEVRGRDLGLR